MKYNELKLHGKPDFPIELYHIDHNHPKYEMNCHYHKDIEIIRVLSGKLSVFLNNREITANAASIVFVNSETLHSAIPEDCVYECIVFDFSFFLSVAEKSTISICERLSAHELSIHCLFDCNTNEDVFNTANALFELMQKKSSFYRIAVTGKIYELFSLILDNKLFFENISSLNSGDEKSNTTLKKVLSFIRENYDKPLTLEQMSNVAQMSDKYFCSFFKKMTNKTPFEYLNCYRIECSARKLTVTDLSVTDIAYGCGFNDLSYYIKTFKSLMGVTPKEFRKGNTP